ncbi:unnamed protein product, partial [Iphiclides podalirius]
MTIANGALHFGPVPPGFIAIPGTRRLLWIQSKDVLLHRVKPFNRVKETIGDVMRYLCFVVPFGHCQSLIIVTGEQWTRARTPAAAALLPVRPIANLNSTGDHNG